MKQHPYIVTVIAETRKQADKVMVERIEHDEDYGFEYLIRHKSEADKPTIKREFLGGSEDITFADFARNVIQDYDVAEKIANDMLDGDGEYVDMSSIENGGISAERYTVIDPDKLREQMPSSDNAGCDNCGTNDREPGARLCSACIDDITDNEQPNLRERLENLMAALDEAQDAVNDGKTMDASARIDDAGGIAAEMRRMIL